MKSIKAEKIRFFILMCSFGFLGLFVKGIGLPSVIITCLRAWLAALCVCLYFLIAKKKPDIAGIKNNIAPIVISGVGIGGCWICLFGSYNYTTIATATPCYYMAPLFFLVFCILFAGERPRPRHIICIVLAFFGVIMVSGIPERGMPPVSELKGILLALLGAVVYGATMFVSRKIRGVDGLSTNVVQILCAAVAVTPYMLIKYDIKDIHFTPYTFFLLLFLSAVMTGVAYIYYFRAISVLRPDTVAVFSYGDPAVSVLVSAFILKEPVSWSGFAGAAIIIGAAMAAELSDK